MYQNMTSQAQVLLSVLQSNKWMTRSQIADALGKKRLSSWEVILLDRLTMRKDIEARKVKGASRDGFIWQYKLSTQSKTANASDFYTQ